MADKNLEIGVKFIAETGPAQQAEAELQKLREAAEEISKANKEMAETASEAGEKSEDAGKKTEEALNSASKAGELLSQTLRHHARQIPLIGAAANATFPQMAAVIAGVTLAVNAARKALEDFHKRMDALGDIAATPFTAQITVLEKITTAANNATAAVNATLESIKTRSELSIKAINAEHKAALALIEAHKTMQAMAAKTEEAKAAVSAKFDQATADAEAAKRAEILNQMKFQRDVAAAQLAKDRATIAAARVKPEDVDTELKLAEETLKNIDKRLQDEEVVLKGGTTSKGDKFKKIPEKIAVQTGTQAIGTFVGPTWEWQENPEYERQKATIELTKRSREQQLEKIRHLKAAAGAIPRAEKLERQILQSDVDITAFELETKTGLLGAAAKKSQDAVEVEAQIHQLISEGRKLRPGQLAEALRSLSSAVGEFNLTSQEVENLKRELFVLRQKMAAFGEVP